MSALGQKRTSAAHKVMSALGHKQTYAAHKLMSALPPIATAKADSSKRPCLLSLQKRGHVQCGRRCPLWAKSGLMQRSKQLDRPELQVGPVLRAAGPVVEVRPLVAAVHDWRESVVPVHDGFDENQRIVRRAEGVVQVPDGLNDE